MNTLDALKIVINLAENNVLEEELCDEDTNLRRERTRQLRAIKILKNDSRMRRYLKIRNTKKLDQSLGGPNGHL